MKMILHDHYIIILYLIHYRLIHKYSLYTNVDVPIYNHFTSSPQVELMF